MIERYSTKEMKEVWSENNKYNAWLEVELLSCEGWSNLGEIEKNLDKFYDLLKKELRRGDI